MKRSPGRPSIGDDDHKPARVHVTVPPEVYDQAYQVSRRTGVSVPELARRGLVRVLADEADEDE